jgi:hypothetical protein
MTASTPTLSPGTSLRSVTWTAESALADPLNLGGPRQELSDWTRLTAIEKTAGLHLVTIPATLEDQAAQAEAARGALLAREDQTSATVTLLGLQGAHLVVAPGWVVVIAIAERLELAARAAATTCLHEAELSRVERELGASWQALKGIAPTAFEATPATLARRAERQADFVKLIGLRETYAKLGPLILVPHVYPPTLESQVGERLRERLRMFERHELIESTLLAQEQVHSLVAVRIGEGLDARKGHNLEWGIIVLLAAEVLLLMLELLSSSAP